MKIHCSVEGCSSRSPTTMRSMVSLTWRLKLCEFSTRPKPSRKRKKPIVATSSQRLSCMPGDSQRVSRRSATRPSPLNITIFHERLQVRRPQMRRKLVGEIHGAMPAARAADADREVRFAFAQKARNQIIDEAEQLGLERLRLGRCFEVGDDARVRAGERAQLFDVVRVRQEPYVEDEVGVQ